MKARFYNGLDLVNQLEQEKLNNRGGKLAEHLGKHDLLVLTSWVICSSQRAAASSSFI